MNKRRLFQQLSIVLVTTLCLFSSCKNDDDENEPQTVIFTAELQSARNCPEEFINYLTALCNSVHYTVRYKIPFDEPGRAGFMGYYSNIASILSDELYHYHWDHGNRSTIYTIVILAKDASGELIFKYTMEYNNDKTNYYDTWYK